jgi:hypothetical protein
MTISVKTKAPTVSTLETVATDSGGTRSVYIATNADTNTIIEDICCVMTVPSATSGQYSYARTLTFRCRSSRNVSSTQLSGYSLCLTHNSLRQGFLLRGDAPIVFSVSGQRAMFANKNLKFFFSHFWQTSVARMGLSRQTRIFLLLGIDSAFFVLELTVGILVKSLALYADAMHMLNDVLSLVVALYAIRLAAQTEVKHARLSFGWQRAEILGALINGVFLLALCFSIFLEAVQRFIDPPGSGNEIHTLR